MPQIKEYGYRSELQGAVSPPGRRASDAGEQIARGLKEFGAGLAHGGEQIYRKQVLDNTERASTQLSELHSRKTGEWAETLAKGDPNDSTLATNTIAKFDEDSNKIREDISTAEAQRYYDTNLRTLRSNFVQTVVAGQAELKKVATQQNYLGSLNNSSGALMNDPTAFGAVKQLHESSLEQLVTAGSLPREAAIKLQMTGNGQLAESAVRGWIRANPSVAAAQLDAGTFDNYLTGDQKKQLYGEVKVEENSRIVKYKQYKADQEKALKESQNLTYDQFVGLGVEGKLNVDTVMQSNLSGKDKEHFIKTIDRSVANPLSLRTDPDKYHDLFDRITNTPDGDPTKIVSAEQLDREFSRGGLSYSDLGNLRKELARGQTDEGKRQQAQRNSVLSMMKETIYRSAGPRDPQAPEMYLRAQQAYAAAYESGIKNGKTPAELTNPDFVKGVMKPFVRTPVQKLNATLKLWQEHKNKTQNQTAPQKHKLISEILKRKGLAP